MTANSAETQESHYVLGETLKPMLTHAMGSAIEIFDTTGIPGGGPPPHKHAWEEIYVVLSGEMDVIVDGKTTRIGPGGFAHVPANTPHQIHAVDPGRLITISLGEVVRISAAANHPSPRD